MTYELLSGELWVSLYVFDMLVFRSLFSTQIFTVTFIDLFLNYLDFLLEILIFYWFFRGRR